MVICSLASFRVAVQALQPLHRAVCYCSRSALQCVLLFVKGQLSRSVSMDFIKKEDRAKWSAMNSVSQFGWSGSAVVGGLLIGKLGYGDTFFVTAGMQAIATLIYCCIIPLVHPVNLTFNICSEGLGTGCACHHTSTFVEAGTSQGKYVASTSCTTLGWCALERWQSCCD
jgi:hypothetical protein